ncbi:hypothetical protein BH10PSE17_BH10PSE17_01150 [soil metagenome]
MSTHLPPSTDAADAGAIALEQLKADLRAAEQAEGVAFHWMQQDRCPATVERWEDARLLAKTAAQRLQMYRTEQMS